MLEIDLAVEGDRHVHGIHYGYQRRNARYSEKAKEGNGQLSGIRECWEEMNRRVRERSDASDEAEKVSGCSLGLLGKKVGGNGRVDESLIALYPVL